MIRFKSSLTVAEAVRLSDAQDVSEHVRKVIRESMVGGQLAKARFYPPYRFSDAEGRLLRWQPWGRAAHPRKPDSDNADAEGVAELIREKEFWRIPLHYLNRANNFSASSTSRMPSAK